jgi:hypothetical protein
VLPPLSNLNPTRSFVSDDLDIHVQWSRVGDIRKLTSAVIASRSIVILTDRTILTLEQMNCQCNILLVHPVHAAGTRINKTFPFQLIKGVLS